MKLKEYQLRGWDGLKIKKEIYLGELIIKLLAWDLKKVPFEGSKNLLAVDIYSEIQWIADIPKCYLEYGFYQDIRLNNKLLEAWCDSIYCIIDPLHGNILSERFVK